MLFALRYDDRDQLLAAAPAVFVYASGDSYWQDNYARPLSLRSGFQTGWLEIEKSDLIEKLNSLETGDEHLAECRRRTDAITFQNQPALPLSKAA